LNRCTGAVAAGFGHHPEGQIDHSVPNIGGKNLPDEGGVLFGKTLRPFLVQDLPHLIETLAIGVIQAFRFAGDRQKTTGQIDRVELGLFSIFLAVGFQHVFGDLRPAALRES
jgi:hypothetical protein